MSLSAVGQRAEAVITSKAERDHAGLATIFPGAALTRFAACAATRIPALADQAPYNKARGFNLDDQRVLADIVGFYDDAGIRPAVEVCEPQTGEQLEGLLRATNFSPTASGVTLHVTPRRSPAVGVDGLETYEVEQADHDRYLALLLAAYELPAGASALRRMFGREHVTLGLRRYLAVINGQPAAAAALYTDAGTGLLAGGATLPAFRRRGCQSALIARRLTDAAADTDLVAVTAAAGTASHQNLTRHGFATAHHRSLWQRSGPVP